MLPLEEIRRQSAELAVWENSAPSGEPQHYVVGDLCDRIAELERDLAEAKREILDITSDSPCEKCGSGCLLGGCYGCIAKEAEDSAAWARGRAIEAETLVKRLVPFAEAMARGICNCAALAEGPCLVCQARELVRKWKR